MAHLTLQEVIERINRNYSSLAKEQRARVEPQAHRPEFYVPRIAIRLAQLRFNAFSK